MTNESNFTQLIMDVFRLNDGQTVFVGPVEGNVKYIQSTKCQLIVEGQLRQIVNIVNEMIPNPPPGPNQRAIATRDKVELSIQEVKSMECVLKAVVCSGSPTCGAG